MRMWLIGCGNMAGAMLARWIDSGIVRAEAVDVVNRGDRALPGGVRQWRDLPAGDLPDIVVLGVKPQQLAEVSARYADGLRDVPMLLSILAGVDEVVLARAFPGPVPVPVMPNLPVSLGQGVCVVNAPSADASARARVDRLLAPLGAVIWAEGAVYSAAATLSGCGPAYLFRFIDAMARAGMAMGLPEADATRLALATVRGAAALAEAEDRSPAALADAVASPGGMTRAGLNVLDDGDALNRLLRETLAAAAARGEEMAAAVRG
ncbi:pyrroline-5-carboxylate reductase dimerization domain-containing protein [uncultured Sphingomonas sp.]|uniref:pyrroline-5-carboxylate reductase family protein n=1 Tax=uncultured Sphingomonas sp. TaxID=158754 RepID=UPI002607A3A0|nr:pyrroline-5-carboxylate reductase dimerization domain-containing protein [uncultured Sphingomonas sp.]